MSGIPKVAQGAATIVDDNTIEKRRDDHGFTSPNLHRRVEPKPPAPDSGEVRERGYELTVKQLNSYRTTHIDTHDEESTTSEIP